MLQVTVTEHKESSTKTKLLNFQKCSHFPDLFR